MKERKGTIFFLSFVLFVFYRMVFCFLLVLRKTQNARAPPAACRLRCSLVLAAGWLLAGT